MYEHGFVNLNDVRRFLRRLGSTAWFDRFTRLHLTMSHSTSSQGDLNIWLTQRSSGRIDAVVLQVVQYSYRIHFPVLPAASGQRHTWTYQYNGRVKNIPTLRAPRSWMKSFNYVIGQAHVACSE